jgi:hypothetical protein
VLVGRGEKVPDDAPGPILVCTRNDDLDTVLENTPKSRWRGTCPVPPQFLSQMVFHCARYGRAVAFVSSWARLGQPPSSFGTCVPACFRPPPPEAERLMN